MSKNRSIIIGFIIASVLPALILAIISPLSGSFDIRSVAGTFFVFYHFSAIATLIIGVPSFFILRKLWVITWWTALFVGFLDGMIVAVILRLPGRPHAHDLVVFVPLAIVSAMAFWLIWKRSR